MRVRLSMCLSSFQATIHITFSTALPETLNRINAQLTFGQTQCVIFFKSKINPNGRNSEFPPWNRNSGDEPSGGWPVLVQINLASICDTEGRKHPNGRAGSNSWIQTFAIQSLSRWQTKARHASSSFSESLNKEIEDPFVRLEIVRHS